jgi:Leu/Phe-tRNA-protein transferase
MCEKNLQVPQHLKKTIKSIHISKYFMQTIVSCRVERQKKKQYLVINEWID